MLAPGNRETIAVFNRFLSIMEQVLNWEFIPKYSECRSMITLL